MDPISKNLTRKGRERSQEDKRNKSPEKFEARALDGHHRDYILSLFVGLDRKSTLVSFLLSFLVTLG